MSGNAKQRMTLTNLSEPQQMRELNRQLTWIWEQLLGGLPMKALNEGARAVIDSKAASETVDELGRTVESQSTQISQAAEAIRLKADQSAVDELGRTVSSQSAALSVTAEAIAAEVRRAEEAEGALEGKMNVQADQIEMAVQRTVGGTNLIRTGGVQITAGEAENVEKTHYAQSGTVYRMDAHGADYNILLFGEGVDVYPGGYVLSFWCRAQEMDGQATIRCNLNNGRYGEADERDHYFGEIQPEAGEPVRYELPFEVEYTERMYLRLVAAEQWTTGSLLISDVKLERGSAATGWSPSPDDPAARVVSGSSVVITEEEIRAVTPRFEIGAMDEDGVTMQMRITKDGAVFSHLEAPNVAARYDGPAVITVDPAATSGEIEGGGVYRGLADALAALNNRYLMYDVSIQIRGDSYGMAELRGLGGSSHGLTISGGGHALLGAFRAANCAANLTIADMTFEWTAAGERAYAVNFDNCSYVEMSGCTVNGNGTAIGLYLAWGTKARMENCGLYNVSDTLMIAGGCVDLTAVSLRGSGPRFIWTDGAVVKWEGTRPDGQWRRGVSSIVSEDLEALTVDYGTAAPPTAAISTGSWPMMYADSYATGYVNSWDYPRDRSNDDIYQGYTVDAGRIYGCIWFDSAAIRAAAGGRTVRQAALRLTPRLYTGTGRAVSVRLRGIATGYEARNGAPQLAGSDYGVIGRLMPGETVEVTIPAEAVAELIAGTINGFALFSEDAATIAGEKYSANYARFDGMTSGDENTRPVLTATFG